MQKNKITIISRNEYENSDIETQSKQFTIEQNKIFYENKLQIIENRGASTEGINIVNNLCKVSKNNRLTKTTFVYFQDKVIKIQDEFYLQNPYRNVKVDSQFYNIKKPTQSHTLDFIPNNPLIVPSSQSETKRKKKDLKNIVKNIVKIFLHWLNKYPKKDACTGSMKELLAFHKYNNSLIRAMSQIPEINEAFSTFLSTQSRELIENSRIHDKPTHLEKLKKYESVFGMTKKSVGILTSGNGSNEGNSSENKNGSGSEDKEKLSMNSENNLNGEKMFAEPNGEMNENINNSKGSDSDKLFNSSNNGSSEHNNNNRNKRSSSGSAKENYSRGVENYSRGGEMINNGDNQLFFSSGSDQGN